MVSESVRRLLRHTRTRESEMAGLERDLAGIFGIDERSLEARRAFVRLGREEQALLQRLLPWAERVAPELARRFYDWQFAFAPTRAFFEQ